jgi:hypothetical protein
MVQTGELEGKTGNVICKTKHGTHKKIQFKHINLVPPRHASAEYFNSKGIHPLYCDILILSYLLQSNTRKF